MDPAVPTKSRTMLSQADNEHDILLSFLTSLASMKAHVKPIVRRKMQVDEISLVVTIEASLSPFQMERIMKEIALPIVRLEQRPFT